MVVLGGTKAMSMLWHSHGMVARVPSLLGGVAMAGLSGTWYYVFVMVRPWRCWVALRPCPCDDMAVA